MYLGVVVTGAALAGAVRGAASRGARRALPALSGVEGLRGRARLSALATSSADCQRSVGRFARHLLTTFASAGDTPGWRSRSGTGWLVRIAAIVADGVSP